MNKKAINIFIFCISLILTFTITMQYISTKSILNSDDYSSQYLATLKIQLDKLELERKELTQDLAELNKKVAEYADTNEKIKENNKLLFEELNTYKIMSGGYDVKGEGLIITISEDASSMNPYYSLQQNTGMVLVLVSNLNSAGAEAISINDQRYTSYTELVPVSNFFSINGKHVSAPFVIKVIGDQRTLESALSFPGGILDTLRNNYGFIVEIEKSSNIEINGTGKLKTFKYLESVVPMDDELLSE